MEFQSFGNIVKYPFKLRHTASITLSMKYLIVELKEAWQSCIIGLKVLRIEVDSFGNILKYPRSPSVKASTTRKISLMKEREARIDMAMK
mmetsp:Transcript_4939/g.7310  ORF Transcript_4939/g.7310 Transcript_4939/m.7310 type:complete len:90 (-) Transcript_4939:290-559(-)